MITNKWMKISKLMKVNELMTQMKKNYEIDKIE